MSCSQCRNRSYNLVMLPNRIRQKLGTWRTWPLASLLMEDKQRVFRGSLLVHSAVHCLVLLMRALLHINFVNVLDCSH